MAGRLMLTEIAQEWRIDPDFPSESPDSPWFVDGQVTVYSNRDRDAWITLGLAIPNTGFAHEIVRLWIAGALVTEVTFHRRFEDIETWPNFMISFLVDMVEKVAQ